MTCLDGGLCFCCFLVVQVYPKACTNLYGQAHSLWRGYEVCPIFKVDDTSFLFPNKDPLKYILFELDLISNRL